MRIPVVKGMIDRRILVNFRVDPGALAAVLPAPFRPQIIHGQGVAGICLIRLHALRPRGLPAAVGVSSENAAHRIAVEWEEGGKWRQGVYIPRRDTNSRLNAIAGGRLFPGLHHFARFDVQESAPVFHVAMHSRDGSAAVEVKTRLAAALPAGSVFQSLAEASAFFEAGSVGYSPARQTGCFDGLALQTQAWKIEPLAVDAVHSSFFEDRAVFPAGTVAFDSAFLMRNIPHEWHEQQAIRQRPAR